MACACGCNTCGPVKMLSGLSDITVTPQPQGTISVTGMVQGFPVWVWGIGAYLLYRWVRR